MQIHVKEQYIFVENTTFLRSGGAVGRSCIYYFTVFNKEDSPNQSCSSSLSNQVEPTWVQRWIYQPGAWKNSLSL